jgi:hypothetical protein
MWLSLCTTEDGHTDKVINMKVCVVLFLENHYRRQS